MIKMQLPNITRKKLKIVFAVHLFSAMFAMLAWPNNNGYLFINLLFCGCLVWSMAAPQVEPLLVSLGVNILAIVFEVVFLCVHWPPAFTSHHLFSAVMAVTNLVARIVSSLVILLDVKKYMEADPKYKVETPEKEKDVSIGD